MARDRTACDLPCGETVSVAPPLVLRIEPLCLSLSLSLAVCVSELDSSGEFRIALFCSSRVGQCHSWRRSVRGRRPSDRDMCNSESADFCSGLVAAGPSLSVGITRGTSEASSSSKLVLCLLSSSSSTAKEMCLVARSIGGMEVDVDGMQGETSVVDYLFK